MANDPFDNVANDIIDDDNWLKILNPGQQFMAKYFGIGGATPTYGTPSWVAAQQKAAGIKPSYASTQTAQDWFELAGIPKVEGAIPQVEIPKEGLKTFITGEPTWVEGKQVTPIQQITIMPDYKVFTVDGDLLGQYDEDTGDFTPREYTFGERARGFASKAGATAFAPFDIFGTMTAGLATGATRTPEARQMQEQENILATERQKALDNLEQLLASGVIEPAEYAEERARISNAAQEITGELQNERFAYLRSRYEALPWYSKMLANLPLWLLVPSAASTRTALQPAIAAGGARGTAASVASKALFPAMQVEKGLAYIPSRIAQSVTSAVNTKIARNAVIKWAAEQGIELPKATVDNLVNSYKTALRLQIQNEYVAWIARQPKGTEIPDKVAEKLIDYLMKNHSPQWAADKMVRALWREATGTKGFTAQAISDSAETMAREATANLPALIDEAMKGADLTKIKPAEVPVVPPEVPAATPVPTPEPIVTPAVETTLSEDAINNLWAKRQPIARRLESNPDDPVLLARLGMAEIELAKAGQMDMARAAESITAARKFYTELYSKDTNTEAIITKAEQALEKATGISAVTPVTPVTQPVTEVPEVVEAPKPAPTPQAKEATIKFKPNNFEPARTITISEAQELRQRYIDSIDLITRRLERVKAKQAENPEFRSYDRFVDDYVDIATRVEEQQVLLEANQEELDALNKALANVPKVPEPTAKEILQPKVVSGDPYTELGYVINKTKPLLFVPKSTLTSQRFDKLLADSKAFVSVLPFRGGKLIYAKGNVELARDFKAKYNELLSQLEKNYITREQFNEEVTKLAPPTEAPVAEQIQPAMAEAPRDINTIIGEIADVEKLLAAKKLPKEVTETKSELKIRYAELIAEKDVIEFKELSGGDDALYKRNLEDMLNDIVTDTNSKMPYHAREEASPFFEYNEAQLNAMSRVYMRALGIEVPTFTKPPSLTEEITAIVNDLTTEVQAARATLKGLKGEDAKVARTTLKVLERQLAHSKASLEDVNQAVNASPKEKSLRQQIVITGKYKGLPATQMRGVYKAVSGGTSLAKMTIAELEEVLKRVQILRPRTIKGQRIATLKTERAVASLKEVLITSKKLDNTTIRELKAELGIRAEKYESAASYATERELRAFLRAMNREAEIGLVAYKIRVAEGLAKYPEIAKAIDDIRARIGKVREPVYEGKKKAWANVFWDVQIYALKLQEAAGGQLSDTLEMTISHYLENNRKSAVMNSLLQELNPIVGNISEKALERVRQQIASENKMGPKPPKDITENELRLADYIGSELFAFQNPVRFYRFYFAYYKFNGNIDKMKNDEDFGIHDAPKKDLQEASWIYESRGEEALKNYLETKDWGVRKSGYEPHVVINPRLQLSRMLEAYVGKSHLKTRRGVYFAPQEKNLLQRRSSYIRQILNLSMEAYFMRLAAEYEKIADKLANPVQVANVLEATVQELKGYYVKDWWAQVALRVGGYSFSVLSLAPHMSFRNLLQILIAPDQEIFFDPRNKWLDDIDQEYIKTYVNQFHAIEREQLLQQYMGRNWLEKIVQRITYYPLSDVANRDIRGMWGYINKVTRAYNAYKESGDINKFINGSGILSLEKTEQIRILELLSMDKVEFANKYIGTVTGVKAAIMQAANLLTTLFNFRYGRPMRSYVEMLAAGRLVGSLMTFPRGVGQLIFRHFEKLRPSYHASGAEKKRAAMAIPRIILGMLLADAIYQKVTGRRSGAYNPLQIAQWDPGGLSIGALQTLSESLGYLLDIAKSGITGVPNNYDATDEFIKSLTRLGDMYIPFYGSYMNLLETMYNMQYLDRATYRWLRSQIDQHYQMNEDFYKVEREWITRVQHALFGGEAPPKTALQQAQEAYTEAFDKLGKNDEDAYLAKRKALTSADDLARLSEDWRKGRFVYTTSDMYSAIRSSMESIDKEEVYDDKNFSPLAQSFMTAYTYMQNYYYALPAGDARSDYRKTIGDDSVAWTEAYLFFWGRVEGISFKYDDRPEAQYERSKRINIVRNLIEKYNIPLSAIDNIEEIYPTQ